MSDASTTTETPPAETPPVTPPAPATAETLPAETPEGVPSIEEFVNDESLDLESSGLPEKTQGEIKKLRGDAKKYRETATAWETATDGWDQESVDMLRTALAGAKQDPTAVAQWFLDNARNLAGDQFDTILADITGAETPPPTDGDEDDEPGSLTPEQVAEMVKKAIEEDRKERETTTAQQARVQEIIDQTEALGFGPTHPMHTALLSEAKKLDGPDRLEKAAELLIEHGAKPAKNDNETSQDAPAEAGRTPVPPEGVTPAGTQKVRDPKQAAQERLDKVLGSARGFSDVAL